MQRLIPFLMVAALAACSAPSGESETAEANAVAEDEAGNSAPAAPSDVAADVAIPEPPPPGSLIGEAVALAEWRKADNRTDCAPLALASDAGGEGKPRRATFSGGWAVAFDRPELRSAYGVAGSGLLPEDRAEQEERVARLEAQWPYIRRFGPADELPAGSVAGYGLEGAKAYPADNPDGRGQDSLAYLRIPGQACQYNIWSKLGRGHLEALLDHLRMVDTGER